MGLLSPFLLTFHYSVVNALGKRLEHFFSGERRPFVKLFVSIGLQESNFRLSFQESIVYALDETARAHLEHRRLVKLFVFGGSHASIADTVVFECERMARLE